MLKQVTLLVVMTIFSLVALAEEPTNQAETLKWEDLIPEGYDPYTLLDQFFAENNIDTLPDDDPKVAEFQERLRKLEENAPINENLNGKLVRLPGYVIPLETDGQKSSEFLLVPYFGACIHVPPPPANQTVYVITKDQAGAEIRRLFDIVWVTGEMKALSFSSDLANAGYTMESIQVTPYQQTTR